MRLLALFPCPLLRLLPTPGLVNGLFWLGLATSPAAPVVWDGGASGLGTSWNSAANWQGDQLPAQSAGTELRFDSRNGGPTLLPQMSLGGNRVAGQIIFDGGLGGLPELLQVDANGSGGSTGRLLTLHNGLTLANTTSRVVFRGANGGLTLELGADIRFETSAGAMLQLQAPLTGAHGLTLDGAGTVRLDAASHHSGGTTVQAGTLLLGNSAGSATGTGPFHLALGAGLGGSGQLAPAGNASLTLAGTLAPGVPGENSGLGTLILAPEQGDALFMAGAGMAFELGSGSVSDRLVFASAGSGRLDLSALTPGSLRVSWAAGATPALDSAFDLLDWSAVTGSGITGLTPALLDLPTDGMAPGWQWDLSAFSASGILIIVPEPSRAGLLFLAAMAMLRRQRSPRFSQLFRDGAPGEPSWGSDNRLPAGAGHKAPLFATGTVGETHFAIMTGTDQQYTGLLRAQQKGGDSVAMGNETVGRFAGLQIKAPQPAIRGGRDGAAGIEKPECQDLGPAGRPQRALLFCRAVEIPAAQLAVTAAGDEFAAVWTEGDAEHRHAVASECTLDRTGGGGEHLRGAITAGSGDMLAVRTDRQGQHPVRMRLDIPERPALGQGEPAHTVVGTTRDQELAVGCGHRAQRAVTQAGETAALPRPAKIDQPNLAGTAGRTTGHRQQRTTGNKTEAKNALGQVANSGAQHPVLRIPSQHFMVTARDQHLAVAIERQCRHWQRSRVTFGRRFARCLLDQPGQGYALVGDIKNRSLGNPRAQQLDLRRRQGIRLLRHAVILVVSEDEAHQLTLVRFASDQGRLTAVARAQQLLNRVQTVRSLGLLGPMAFQTLIGKDRHNLTDKRHRRCGNGERGEGKKQAGNSFHRDGKVRAPPPRFHRAGSKSLIKGSTHRRFKGPRAVAAEPFIQRLQALDEIRHLPPRQQAASRRAEMSPAAERSEFINRAALVGAECRTGTIRVCLELLAPRRAHALGGEQGLAPGQDRSPAGQAKVAAAGERPAVALGRPGGQVPVNGSHLGEGVSETGGRLPAGHGKGLLERVVGIEPTWPAWKAGTLPLSYTRKLRRSSFQFKPFPGRAQRRILSSDEPGAKKIHRRHPKKTPSNSAKGIDDEPEIGLNGGIAMRSVSLLAVPFLQTRP